MEMFAFGSSPIARDEMFATLWPVSHSAAKRRRGLKVT
jgi:hypothetical protein